MKGARIGLFRLVRKRLSRLVDSDEGSGNGSALRHQHVERTAGSAGVHRFHNQACFPQFLTQGAGREMLFGAGADQKRLGLSGVAAQPDQAGRGYIFPCLNAAPGAR